MSNAWASGGEAVQQVQRVAQNVAHQAQIDIEPHGILHSIIEHVPGGEWTVLSMFLIGVGTTAWWKFGKRVEGFISKIVERQIAKRKQD